MKEIKITALNEKGKNALKQHYDESRKLRIIHKITFKQLGFRQKIESTDPFILFLEIKNKYFRNVLGPEKFKNQIIETMSKNGANPKDYKIEVIE